MHLDLVSLPHELAGRDLSGTVCVVFDVLRATTTMTAAAAHGAAEIRAFATIDEARAAHARCDEGPKLLAGEVRCARPAGFDLGNSPGDFTAARVADRTIFMATTNGTRAVRACAGARRTFVAALCNLAAIQTLLESLALDVMFVPAGVDGAPGGEDADAIATLVDLMMPSDALTVAPALRELAYDRTYYQPGASRSWFAESPGGLNLRRAGLENDVLYCGGIDRFGVVVEAFHRASYAELRATAIARDRREERNVECFAGTGPG